MACRVWSRVAAALACPPPGASVHSPAPKSAPDSTVYAVIPTRMNTIGTSASMVTIQGYPAEPAQQPHHGPGQPDVHDPQRRVAERDEVRPRHRGVDPHHLVDDPRLPRSEERRVGKECRSRRARVD